MTDGTGAVVWSAQYDPFGKATINVEQVTNNLRYPGQYFDAETGLCYNWNRDYNQQLGRYVESDPIGMNGGINIYAYVANQPTVYIDPTGLWFPYRHGQYTFEAAREAGCSINEANKLAVETAKVDFREGANDPENAYWHAMVDGTSKDPAKSIRQYNDLQRNARQTCDIKDLALALHALQDSHAPAHGFKPWGGHWYEYGKHYADPFWSVGGHADETRRFLEDARRRCPCLCN
jgi:RHS repeat-associated protein